MPIYIEHIYLIFKRSAPEEFSRAPKPESKTIWRHHSCKLNIFKKATTLWAFVVGEVLWWRDKWQEILKLSTQCEHYGKMLHVVWGMLIDEGWEMTFQTAKMNCSVMEFHNLFNKIVKRTSWWKM